MADAMDVFDRRAVRRHRDRAAARVERVAPVLAAVAERLVERLDDITRRFATALDLGGRGVVAPLLRARGIEVVASDLAPAMAARAGGPAGGCAGALAVAADEEWLPFAPASFDLIVANLSLHWVGDLPGCLLQLRRALRPDGLLLASVPTLGTLDPWRAVLTATEAGLRGGASPRVSPFPELRDCAHLLQRAGFAMPVADAEEIVLSYARRFDLLRDLRDAGETNAVAARDRRTPPRALFPAALAAMPEAADGRMAVPLRLAMLTAWAPAPGQPQPLRPGSAQHSLAAALTRLP